MCLPMMLGLAVILTLNGCETPPRTFRPLAPVSPPTPAVNVHPAGDSEAGPEGIRPVDTTSRDVTPHTGTTDAAPGPIDPVADQIVRSILASLPDRARPGGAAIRIGLNGVRNQSHTGPDEYGRLLRRLAQGLSDAGFGSGVTFEAAPEVEPEYRLDGAAYLATRGGFDVWELYLRLSSTSRRGIIWRLDEPVTVLRQPRSNQPQFLAFPSGPSR